MQSWILTFALVAVAGGAVAEDALNIQAPDGVPPIPSPWEPMEARSPIDGPWPAAPADSASTVAEPGVPVAVPAIPAPKLTRDAAPQSSDDAEAGPLAQAPDCVIS